jgi:LysM repeat protein
MVVPTGGANGARDQGRLPIMYAPPIPMAGPRSFVHTVKAGETLPGIASRYRVSVEDLRRWNKIGRLAAGQRLMVQTKGTPPRAKGGKATKGKPRVATKPVKKSAK